MERDEVIRRVQGGENLLELSIEAWEDKRETLPNKFADMSSDACALCSTRDVWGCSICVITKYTGKPLCRGTPYRNCVSNPTKYNASRMVMFLKSLRED